jgi:uncharacterized protein (TIGR00303 family)
LDFPDIFASRSSVKEFASSNPFFVCVISHTETSEIPGLTVAGANPELVKYTAPADSEFLYYGRCKCIAGVPATPDGKPTPALITRAALKSAGIPLLVVEAGTKVKPSIPCIPLGIRPGKNITREDAMTMPDVEKTFDYCSMVGRELAKASDLVVVGESIPGGTTTALAVLSALGIDARFKVSSSMPENPHQLKNQVVASALQRAGGIRSAFEAVSLVGDPMMPAVAGIASGVMDAGSKVLLAGGTQMTAILAILKDMGSRMDNICIGTTTYVARDPSSDLEGLARSISPDVPVFSCDLHLDQSKKPGLQAFARGFVKEGVGAGGAAISAMLKTGGRIDGKMMMAFIEQEYEASIERPSVT